jgi:hypothetical protein
VRSAGATFNIERAWVLEFSRDQQDGHLLCAIRPSDAARAEPGYVESRWPGPYEAKLLTDGLCAISLQSGVDWEMHLKYGLRPVGFIRKGVCHPDAAALEEATRNAARHMFAVKE